MAEVRRQTTASLASSVPEPNHVIAGLLAGEVIAKGQFVYIKSDGLVHVATGAAENAAAKARGVAAEAASVGEAVTIHRGVRYRWTKHVADSGPNPGVELYLSGTNAGELADAASTGGLTPIAFVVNKYGVIQLIGDCA